MFCVTHDTREKKNSELTGSLNGCNCIPFVNKRKAL